MAPSKTYMLFILPFVLLDLLSSLTLLCLAFVICKMYGLIAIGLVVLLNFTTQNQLRFTEILEDDLQSKRNAFNSLEIQNGTKDISKMVQLNRLTSWVINTVMVKSIVKLQLMSSAIATIVYSIFNILSIVYKASEERTILKDYSILICAPPKIQPELYGNITQIFFNTSSALIIRSNTAFPVAVRMCQHNELPNDIIRNVVIPILCATVILKIGADLALYKYADYKRLAKGCSEISLTYKFAFKVFVWP